MIKNKKEENTISKITHELNDVLMRSIERLDDEELMNKKGYAEVERSNAISKASQTVVNIIKTNMRIMEMASKQNKSIDDIKKELDK